MAAVVVALGISPSEYWDLTVAERHALVTELNRRAKQK